MLMRTDPFRAMTGAGTWSRPAPMPMDAHRTDDELVIAFDLPGLTPDAIEVGVERNTLTVKAERRPAHTGDSVRTLVTERPLGVFSRQLYLGDGLDTEHITANYEAGVLTLRIPVAEQTQPRRIAVTGTESAPDRLGA
jgi:HSP20 family protein